MSLLLAAPADPFCAEGLDLHSPSGLKSVKFYFDRKYDREIIGFGRRIFANSMVFFLAAISTGCISAKWCLWRFWESTALIWAFRPFQRRISAHRRQRRF